MMNTLLVLIITTLLVAITAAAARRLRVYWRLKQVECRIQEMNKRVDAWGNYIKNQLRRDLDMLNDTVDALEAVPPNQVPALLKRVALRTSDDPVLADLKRVALRTSDDPVLAEIKRAKKWSANRAQSDGQLPSIFYFALIILPHQRRADILMDIWDWYAEALRDHGRVFAYLACALKIAQAWVGTALDFMLRVAEIVGKFRGAK
jgi:hypothetical protein